MKINKLQKSVTALLLMIIAGTLNLASAQEKETQKPSMDLSAQVFMNWHTGLTSGNDKGSGNKTNTFDLERVYLNWQPKFDDMFSARVTLDIANDSDIEGATQASDSNKTNQKGSITSKYRPYIKYAYLQAKKSFGPVDGTARAGMIDTPIIGFIDGFQDQRWVHKNLIDDAKNVLPGATGIDTSADIGISLGMDFVKMVNLNLALTNGEGYKNTNESLSTSSTDNSKNSSQSKAVYARLGVTPIQPLCVFGFYRYEGTSVNYSDNHKGYYGAGVAWKDELFKAGADYILPFQKLNGKDAVYGSSDAPFKSGDKKKMSLLEFWLTVTPQKYIQIPLLVLARYGFGNDSGQDNSMTTYMGAGIGYEYSKNIRVAAWYDQYDSEANDTVGKPNPMKVFSVKADIKI